MTANKSARPRESSLRNASKSSRPRGPGGAFMQAMSSEDHFESSLPKRTGQAFGETAEIDGTPIRMSLLAKGRHYLKGDD